MDKSSAGFESELRISAMPVILTLMVLAEIVLFVSGRVLDPSRSVYMQVLGVVLFVLLGVVWALDRWKTQVGRWFVIATLIIVIEVAANWQGVPGALALMAIPTGLAAALINVPAAIATALGETILLFLLPKIIAAGADGAEIGIALVAIWGAAGIMYAVYRPVYHVAGWAWGYYERALRLLEEARGRKAEMEQAIDDLAHANRQLALANERMATLRAIAEEAQKAKTTFVANVSHEFRTPLNMIIGLVELMVETPEIYAVALSPKMREDLKVVHRNCEHLSNMVNDVLDLTRMETGRLALHRERVDLGRVIDTSVAVVRPLLQKKQLDLQTTIPDDLSQIYCDRTRIQQVILNLVSNAARFTEVGGITIKVDRQDQHVLVSVTDTGPGISPEDADRIFEPFCQGTGELWRDKGGSGLGLSISRQFIKLHGGQMWIESELGVGTSVFFTLPVSPSVEHIVRPGHQIREDWVWRERAFRTDRAVSTDQLVKSRVVICDETGALYPEFIRYSDKIEFVDTRDLAQAMREIQRGPANAVVLNTSIPGNLWSLIETVKLEIPDTPVIGCSVPWTTERAIGAGALGHLVKPVTRADLEEVIQAVGKTARRVLVVDDDPDVLKLFSRMLRACDSTLEIVTASSGEQALDELRRTHPDLMLLDIVMPDIDGWMVLELMGQDKTMGDVSTFLVSAQDPADQPPVSEFLLVTMDKGLPLSKLLRCSLEISALLLKPEARPDPVPV
jgi:signal transduction histidine kinase/CheY-like chemotaxis protein